MHRRSFLGLAVAPLAGCTVGALAGSDRPDDRTPTADCPAVLEADRAVCPGVGASPLTVSRSSATVSGPDWTLRVAVTNRAEAPYGCNPFAWSIVRRVGDAWTRVAPDIAVEPWIELAPGDRYGWLLAETQTGPGGPDHRVFVDLDPGGYAFAVPFDGPERVAAVAPFAVEA